VPTSTANTRLSGPISPGRKRAPPPAPRSKRGRRAQIEMIARANRPTRRAHMLSDGGTRPQQLKRALAQLVSVDDEHGGEYHNTCATLDNVVTAIEDESQ